MPQQISPFINSKYGWNFGESGWNSGMDEDILKFSFLFDRNIDGIVSTLPAASNGKAYFLTTDNSLYFGVGTVYYSTPTPKWFEVVIRSTGDVYQYNGSALVKVDSPANINSRLSAVELTVSTLGSAAFKDITYFASQEALDVAVANAAAYTDSLENSLSNTFTGANHIGYAGGTLAQYLNLSNTSVIYPESYGAVGDGVTNDSVALQSAITAAAGKTLFLKGSYFVPTNTILSVLSNTHIVGTGKIVGPAIASQGLPSAYIKVQGALTGTPLAIGYPIGAGVSSFTETNSFAADDLLVLSNFPTDATDAYTLAAPNWLGEQSRLYSDTSASNLRQTRRREMCVVRSATSSVFELTGGVNNNYISTSGLQFQKVNAVSNVNFDATLENIWLLFDYSRDCSFKGTAVQCFIQARSSWMIDIDCKSFDAKDTQCLVSIQNHTQNYSVRGNYTGGNNAYDNALVRVSQGHCGSIDISVSDTKNKQYGFLVDTNFEEDPQGFCEGDISSINAKITANRVASPAVFIAGNPYAARTHGINLAITGNTLSGLDELYMVGTRGAEIAISSPDARIRFDGVEDVRVRGQYATIFETTFVDPRGSGTKSNTRLNLERDYDFAPTVVGTGTAGTATYTLQAGRAQRSGRWLSFQVALSYSGHTGSGNMSIAGLPVASVASGDGLSAIVVDAAKLAFSGSYVVGELAGGSTSFNLVTPSTGGSAPVAMASAATIIANGSYPLW